MLFRVLAEERTALAGHKHARLSDLAARKERLVDELGSTEEGLRMLVALRSELLRNLALLGAVRAGLSTLRSTANRPKPMLRTYGPDGQDGATAPSSAQTLGRF